MTLPVLLLLGAAAAGAAAAAAASAPVATSVNIRPAANTQMETCCRWCPFKQAFQACKSCTSATTTLLHCQAQTLVAPSSLSCRYNELHLTNAHGWLLY